MRLFLLFVSLLIVNSRAVQIDCEFGFENYPIGDLYSCKAKRLNVATENDAFDSIIGDHLPGSTSADVKVFHVDDQILKYFPSDIENFFPNLKGLKVVSSGLKVLTQDNFKWLPDLRFLIFDDNNIESLNDDLFKFNSRLNHISFNSNKISIIAANLLTPLNEIESVSFKNNECIDEEFNTREEIDKAHEEFLEKCSVESSMKEEMADYTDYFNSKEETRLTKFTKITRTKSRQKFNLKDLKTNEDDSEVSCELNNIFWKFSDADLLSCSIMTQTIDQPGYNIKIDADSGKTVQGLSFNDNQNVKFLPTNIGSVFPNLIELSVKNTYLETISGKIFADLQKLKKLSISNNDLQVIENETFAGLSNLEELDLSEGNIRYIEEGAFAGVSSLKVLHLGGNKINHLQAKTFEGLTELRNISLELNHLSDVDENLFSSNKKLVNVWLNGNKISILSPTVFEEMNSLGYVDLQGNECIDGVFDISRFNEMKAKLSDNCDSAYIIRETYKKHTVSSKTGSTREEYGEVRNEYYAGGDEELVSIVQYADVEETGDEEYPTVEETTEVVIRNKPEDKKVFCEFGEVFWHFSQENLKTCLIKHQIIDSKGFEVADVIDGVDAKGLNMGYNSMLKFMPENLADSFPNLVELSVQNSSLVVLSQKNFAGLNNLKSLNLANNNIKFIDADAFDDLEDLEELDLSGNSLEYVDENLFIKLKNLKTLRISDNKLHFVHTKLFRNLRNLQNVSISNNQLSTIDENLFKTNRDLKNVWLQNNKVKSLSPNLFNTANDLEYVDLRENKCIDTVYETKAFDVMKSEILKKCGDGYVLKHGKKTTKKSDKKNEKKKKKEKNKSKPKEEEIKEVICEYEDVFWPTLNKTMFTCVVSSDQVIDGPGYTISVNANPFAVPLIDGFSVQALSFGNNKNIKFLPDDISEAFPNLVAMSAAETSLETIIKKSFGNLKQLKSLDLGQNKIKSFESDTFEELSSLEELILDDNEMEVIEETTFTNTKRLKKLKMNGNKLKSVDTESFEFMNELVEISMELEDPTLINENFFKSNKNLKKITINGKPWGTNLEVEDISVEDTTTTTTTSKPTTTEVPTTLAEITSAEKDHGELSCKFYKSFSVQTNSSLFTCELDGSELNEESLYNVKTSLQLPQVRILRLKNVRSFPENLSKVFPDLIEIIASDSGLTGVTKKNFEGLDDLKYLDLSKNSIKHIEPEAFDDLEDLEFLDLSENKMEFIEETLFAKLNNLNQLHLSSNQLHYIHKKLFKHLANLEVITIDNNLLSVVEPFTFRQNQKLKIVDLSHNKIESLNPKILDHFKDLRSVNLTGNKCVSGEFDSSNFDEMKEEIKQNCITKTIEDSNEDESWIDCDFDPSDNSCTVTDHSIESSNYRIKIKSDDESTSNGQSVEHLAFVGSHIKYLPKSFSEVFPNLVEISTIDTSLNSISRENFMNLPKLKTLNINHVEMFEPDTFEDMTTLENLHIESDVDEIDEATFSKLHNLKVFYYETKNVLAVDPKAFDQMTELVEFNLNSPVSSNDSSEIEEKIQQNNPNLLKLTVNDKVIKDETPLSTTEAFKSSSKAPTDYEMSSSTQSEYLQTMRSTTTSKPRKTRPKVSATTPKPEQRAVTCYLNYTEWSSTNSTLITCNLENQSIDDPETIINLTPYSDYVEGLRITHNKKVKFLPENIAKSFPNLVQLSAKNSSLETILKEDFDGLKKLKTLDLSDNNLESIEPETFIELESLEELDLSNNQIDYIDENAFPINLKNLKTIDLKGNRITFLHPKTFEKLTKLIMLNLEGNDLPQNVLDDLLKTKPFEVKILFKANIEKHPEEEDNIIPCSFSDKFWHFSETNFFSCELKDSIDNQNFMIKPSSRNHRVRGLSFIDNKNIKFLPQDLAQTLPNLVEITAFNSSVERIYPDTFKDLRKVKLLNLANNKIKQLEPSTFNDFPELEELDLSNNEIEEIDESMFERLPSLKTLYLSGNNLKRLPVNIFEKLSNLRNISLENNKFFKIHPNLFSKNLNLENIWLNGNQLSSLNSNTFSSLKKLEYVDLQNNICIDKFYEGSKLDQMKLEIDSSCKEAENLINPVTYRPDTKPSITKTKETICNFSYVDSLYTCTVTDDTVRHSDTLKPSSLKVQALIINGKKSVNLPDNIHSIFPNLQRISIKNSSLTSINPRAFKGLNKLIRVDLSDNKIDSIHTQTFAELPNLEEINLDHNRIKSLHRNIFPRRLKFLNLESNQINSLHPNVFDNLPGLTVINLEHNGISQLPEELFKENRNLETILFSGNRIKFMSEKTFKNLPKLNAIDFEENECVSGFYNKPSMKALFAEIFRNCQGSKTNDQDVVDSSQQPEYYDQFNINDYDEQTRVDPNESFSKSKKLSCKFSETYSSSANAMFFTCYVESQPIETTDYTFDDNPENVRVKRAVFTNNKKTDFMPDLIGQSFPNLVELEVQNTSLKTIRPENFKNLRQLKYLDLSGNNLKFIEPETFDELNSMEQLHLSRNNLIFIAQPKLQSLKNLDLDNNQLSFIDSSTFKKIPNLISLNLENNQLTEIKDELFTLNSKLETVNIKNNKLDSIGKEAFSSNNFKVVDLRDNKCLNRLFLQDSLQTVNETVEKLCQPLDKVKESLATCQRDIGNCSSTADFHKFKIILRKAEVKIKQLNAHQRRLKNGITYEKNLVKKLKQKVKAVEDENVKLKSNSNECHREDRSVQLDCVFEISESGSYACRPANLNIGSENTTISEVQGEHKRGKRTADVTSLTIADQSVKNIPLGVSSFFTNLQELKVLNSGLTGISLAELDRMNKLTILVIKGNNIETIEKDSFDDLTTLETLDLSNNNIYNLPERAFKKLPNLKFIDVSNNRLKSLPSEFIPETNQLQKISFANNILEIIDPKHFKSLQKLSVIDFNGNNCFDGKFLKSESDDVKKIMIFFGEIAISCVGEGYGVCNA